VLAIQLRRSEIFIASIKQNAFSSVRSGIWS